MKMYPNKYIALLIAAAFVAVGCSNSSGGGDDPTEPVAPVAPTVSSTIPADLATGVAINADITATFSEEMQAGTISDASFTITQGATPVPGVVSYVGSTASIDPSADLIGDTVYTATVSVAATNVAGTALVAAKTWTFTTGTTVDSTSPSVSSTQPADLGASVALNGDITATFSEPVDPLSLTDLTFIVTDDLGAPVLGAVTVVGNVATFNPTANLLSYAKLYTARVTTGAKDLAGNALAADAVWTFNSANGPYPVNLGSAGNYVILAQSAITTTGVTALTGDIAISPNAASAITGFTLVMDPDGTFSTSTLVTGKVYAANYAPPTPLTLGVAVQATVDAIGDVIVRVPIDFTNLYAGGIGGHTLVPGLYKWTTGINLNAGPVTFDGGPNDVWILWATGSLNLNNNVILSGGAQAKNIFWKVNAATLQDDTHLEGIVLASGAITLNTGATVDGRLLANTAVTLDGNTVIQPAP